MLFFRLIFQTCWIGRLFGLLQFFSAHFFVGAFFLHLAAAIFYFMIFAVLCIVNNFFYFSFIYKLFLASIFFLRLF